MTAVPQRQASTLLHPTFGRHFYCAHSSQTLGSTGVEGDTTTNATDRVRTDPATNTPLTCIDADVIWMHQIIPVCEYQPFGIHPASGRNCSDGLPTETSPSQSMSTHALERNTNASISAVSRYFEALGAQLELTAEFYDGRRIV